ncbi:hypothetical protein EVB29_024 [Rhizobium phage RHph_TM27A]|nr:hypothetical protein EVB29_024 [Rhizobium phage RHph_TM27A]QIG66944.1 hypothetical protein EVB30_024 [Rhizobium phage RHph_TM27B]
MTDNVVTFRGNKPPEPPDDEEYVFVCGECRARTFQLLAGGRIKCSACETEVCGCEPDADDWEKWRKLIPPLPADRSKVEEWDNATVDVHYYADESLSRRRVFKTLNDWNDGEGVFFVSAYSKPDGNGMTWLDIRTEGDREWLLARLDRVREWVVERDLDGTHELTFTPTDDGDENG